MTPAPLEIRLLHLAGCPLVDQVRVALQDCLRSTGIDATVEDIEGPYPSPTLLVNGKDVVTGQILDRSHCCRLDLPTRDQIMTALQRGTMT